MSSNKSSKVDADMIKKLESYQRRTEVNQVLIWQKDMERYGNIRNRSSTDPGVSHRILMHKSPTKTLAISNKRERSVSWKEGNDEERIINSMEDKQKKEDKKHLMRHLLCG